MFLTGRPYPASSSHVNTDSPSRPNISKSAETRSPAIIVNTYAPVPALSQHSNIPQYQATTITTTAAARSPVQIEPPLPYRAIAAITAAATGGICLLAFLLWLVLRRSKARHEIKARTFDEKLRSGDLQREEQAEITSSLGTVRTSHNIRHHHHRHTAINSHLDNRGNNRGNGKTMIGDSRHRHHRRHSHHQHHHQHRRRLSDSGFNNSRVMKKSHSTSDRGRNSCPDDERIPAEEVGVRRGDARQRRLAGRIKARDGDRTAPAATSKIREVAASLALSVREQRRRVRMARHRHWLLRQQEKQKQRPATFPLSEVRMLHRRTVSLGSMEECDEGIR